MIIGKIGGGLRREMGREGVELVDDGFDLTGRNPSYLYPTWRFTCPFTASDAKDRPLYSVKGQQTVVAGRRMRVASEITIILAIGLYF